MISTSYLRKAGWRKVYGILDTEEKVRDFRKRLEDKTRDKFEAFRKAKIRAWHLAKYKVLD